MAKILTRAGAVLAVLAGVLAFSVSPAGAHHPEIEGSIECPATGGDAVVNYTATAWVPLNGNEIGRQNDLIEIYANGALIGSGSFDAPTYSFTGSAPLPAGLGVGDTVTLTALAVGDWGSGAAGGSSRSVDLTVPDLVCEEPTLDGRFTGGGHQIRVDGVRVTRGLTIHCDLLLSNNLEINWQGNQFHMLEHLTTLECFDDPAIIQASPPAPIDTLVGTGTGRYNGEEGYSITFELQDHGEPGRNSDMMSIYIVHDASGDVILDIPLQHLTGGNLQAHADQPHR